MARQYVVGPSYMSPVEVKHLRDTGVYPDNYNHPPPGLLLSLGDGRAIEVTWAMLYAAIKAGVCAVNAQGEPVVFTSDIPHIVRKLIQQAQEARDVHDR